MTRTRTLALTAPLALALAAAAGSSKTAHATGEDMTQTDARCATRLSIALLGVSATAAELASTTPQAAVDAMLVDPRFQERFASFVNARSNASPGLTPEEDAPYWLAKYILQNNRPWKEMFVGPYNVDLDGAGKNVVVTNDPNGLGYFRSKPWLIRYEGSEQAGIKISTAYHIMQNVVGLELVASTNAPGADLTATGRMASPCNGCHFAPWFALDRVASILTVRKGSGAATTFLPPAQPSANILGGLTIHDDGELVQALVANDAFKVHACRTAFQFLYGRGENTCEGVLFDKCVDALTGAGTMQAALGAIAKDASFCQ
jgi:hypothetical protein